MNIPEFLIMAGQLILALSILVTVHELGHYLAARAFGIRVEKFFVFFDFGGYKLFSFRRKGTEYGLGWFPLGGYVKIAGMIDESLDKEQLKREPEPWEFRAKPNWQKFIVMVAGVVMNVILGVLLYAFYLGNYQQSYIPQSSFNQSGVYAYETAREYGFRTGDKLVAVNGKSYDRFEDYLANFRIFFGGEMLVDRDGQLVRIAIPETHFNRVREGIPGFLEMANLVYVDSLPSAETSAAARAGVQPGDRIAAVNGQDLFAFGQLVETLAQFKGDSVDLHVQRGSEYLHLVSAVDTSGRIGFLPSVQVLHSDSTRYTVGSALVYGAGDAWSWLYFNARAMGKIFTGDVPLSKSIESPIGIARIYGPSWDWAKFWWLTAILSMVLAFMNILPIPALDGGHIMFIGIESLIGRKLPDSFMEKAQVFGMLVILALMVFAFGSDILEIVQERFGGK
jgi:regulator of sigma E protease